eukprot:12426231-Karenia_brevis.AAC.1
MPVGEPFPIGEVERFRGSINFLKAGQPKMSVRPLLKDLNPVVWDKHGVGGEADGEESGGAELPEGVESERLRLQEEGEV